MASKAAVVSVWYNREFFVKPDWSREADESSVTVVKAQVESMEKTIRKLIQECEVSRHIWLLVLKLIGIYKNERGIIQTRNCGSAKKGDPAQ